MHRSSPTYLYEVRLGLGSHISPFWKGPDFNYHAKHLERLEHAQNSTP